MAVAGKRKHHNLKLGKLMEIIFGRYLVRYQSLLDQDRSPLEEKLFLVSKWYQRIQKVVNLL